ncbi:MAG: hypothetical protein ACREIU_05215, partial [Planctomycetota bacterium]
MAPTAIFLNILIQCSGNGNPWPPGAGPLVAPPRTPRPAGTPGGSIDGPRTGIPGPSTPSPGPTSPGTPRPSAGGPRTGGGIELGPDLDWADWWWLNAYEYLGPLQPRTPSTPAGEASDRESD